ncbi:hypothetical protein KA005_14380 [bacterium]|nr:hypothetical protein [bacterium]
MKKPVVTVYTNDKNLWLLSGFQYLFKKYWSAKEEVRYVGYAPPGNGTLTGEFTFVSIARRNYPASEWSTGILRSLDKFIEDGEEFMIMMLEDYWLIEEVNVEVVADLCNFMDEQPRKILRLDLTADRCTRRRYSTNFAKVGDTQIIRTSADSPYQMSYQAGIWNLKLMREILQPYENPWQSEVAGTKRLEAAGDKYTVLGTTSPPVRYQPVYRSKRCSLDISKLPTEDHDMMLKRGWV